MPAAEASGTDRTNRAQQRWTAIGRRAQRPGGPTQPDGQRHEQERQRVQPWSSQSWPPGACSTDTAVYGSAKQGDLGAELGDRVAGPQPPEVAFAGLGPPPLGPQPGVPHRYAASLVRPVTVQLRLRGRAGPVRRTPDWRAGATLTESIHYLADCGVRHARKPPGTDGDHHGRCRGGRRAPAGAAGGPVEVPGSRVEVPEARSKAFAHRGRRGTTPGRHRAHRKRLARPPDGRTRAQVRGGRRARRAGALMSQRPRTAIRGRGTRPPSPRPLPPVARRGPRVGARAVLRPSSAWWFAEHHSTDRPVSNVPRVRPAVRSPSTTRPCGGPSPG